MQFALSSPKEGDENVPEWSQGDRKGKSDGVCGDWSEGGDKREEESRCPRSELVLLAQQEGRPFT